MNKILTLRDNKLFHVSPNLYQDTTNNKNFNQRIDASHLYVTNLDSQNYLVIDSFYDVVDIIPKNLISYEENELIIDNLLSFEFFHKRYSNVTSDIGINNIKARYKTHVEQLLKDRKIAVFTLCPTYSCNMKCTYCYQKNYDRRNETITAEKLEEILQKIENEIIDIRKNNPSQKILLELFGGEPLQIRNKDIITRYFDFARNMNCKVNIVTNGYELFDFAVILSKYKDVISELCLTLDGVKDFHNSRRVVGSKEGSYDKISKGIDLFLQLGFRIRVASNIDAQNINSIKDFIDSITEKKWPEYEGFSLYFGRVYDRLYSTKYKNIIYESQILKSILNVFKEEKELPGWVNVAFLKSTERLARMINIPQDEYGKALFHYCWSTSPIIEGYYIDYRGMTYRCTTTVANDAYALGYIDQVGRDAYNAPRWNHGSLFNFKECLHCSIGGFCSGGCPLEKKAYGNQVCNREKENFNDFIEHLFKPLILEKLESVTN